MVIVSHVDLIKYTMTHINYVCVDLEPIKPNKATV